MLLLQVLGQFMGVEVDVTKGLLGTRTRTGNGTGPSIEGPVLGPSTWEPGPGGFDPPVNPWVYLCTSNIFYENIKCN